MPPKIRLIAISVLVLLCAGCVKHNIKETTKAGLSGYKIYATGHVLRSFSQTTDGGFIFGGYTNTTALRNGFMQKCDINGNVLWYKEFGGPKADMFNIVRQTSDGGYIAAGMTASNANGQGTTYYSAAWLVKTDQNGNISWQKTFGANEYDKFYDVIESADHGFIATGASATTYDNFLVIKTSGTGDQLWQQTISKNNYHLCGTSVTETKTGEIAVAGISESHIPLGILYPTLTLLSSQGNILINQKIFNQFGTLPWFIASKFWQYGGYNFEKIIKVPDGLIMAITIVDTLPVYTYGINSDVSRKVVTFKIDMSGNILWTNHYSGMGYGVLFNDLIASNSGGFMISGASRDTAGNNRSWILNADANGNKISEKFIPVTGSAAWLAGADYYGSGYIMGVNAQPLKNGHQGYFGFLKTDMNGKVIE